MYSGTDGVYTHTVKYERDPNDPACGAGVALHVNPDMTLQQVRSPASSAADARACTLSHAAGSVAYVDSFDARLQGVVLTTGVRTRWHGAQRMCAGPWARTCHGGDRQA